MPIPLVVPAAQWSRHSCLHFKCLGFPFSWFDCEPQAHDQLRYKTKELSAVLVRLPIQTEEVFTGAWARVQLVAAVLNGFVGQHG
jgi:hypothetical protein